MNETAVRVLAAECDAAREDRFHRFRLIRWWDQEKLSRAKVLVIGAGALGNEIVKNLALLGIGNVFIADRDRVENSNLSRSVLYRATDNGHYKADVAAAAARQLYPAMRVQPFNGNVVYDLGLGVFRWADLVIAGLDNREARLAINRNCWRVNRPWIDGAIEQVQGCARVFVPDGPCYECTMSKLDWELLQKRRSCNLLTRAEMEAGRTPTTPTISSIIAGVQCQEAVKLLHGLPTISGRGLVFEGLSTDSYLVEYQRKEECYSHEILEDIHRLDQDVSAITVGELLGVARAILGPTTELELARDILANLTCARCGKTEHRFESLGKAGAELSQCPHCPGIRRDVSTFYRIIGNEPFLSRTLAAIGVPPWDIVIARAGERAIGLELAGDAASVLGSLAQPDSCQVEVVSAIHAHEEGLEWR